MNRKSFWIPVGWSTEHKIGSLSLNSNTLVLDAPPLNEGFEVERIPGSWSPHVPEKQPRYRISCGRRMLTERSPVRLRTIPKDGAILVPLSTDRPQTCLEYHGQLHGVFVNAGANHPWTYCGETTYHSERSLQDYKFGVPTCKACLVHRSVWCFYIILPYEPKRDVERRIHKERSAVEKHLRLPTAYARILDDDLFENPTYKPVKYQPPSLDEDDPTMDFDDDPRERKRASAIDSNRRLEETKARVQGHRR